MKTASGLQIEIKLAECMTRKCKITLWRQSLGQFVSVMDLILSEKLPLHIIKLIPRHTQSLV